MSALDYSKFEGVAREIVADRGRVSAKAVGTISGLLVGAGGANPIFAGATAGTVEAFAGALCQSATQRFLEAGARWDDQQELIQRIAAHLQEGARGVVDGQSEVILQVIEERFARVDARFDETLVALAKVAISVADRSSREQRDQVERIERLFLEMKRSFAQQSERTGTAVQVAHVERLYVTNSLVAATGTATGDAGSTSAEEASPNTPDLPDRSSGMRPTSAWKHANAHLAALVKGIQTCIAGNWRFLRLCLGMTGLFSLSGLLLGLVATRFASHNIDFLDRVLVSAAGLAVGLCGSAALLSRTEGLYWAWEMHARGRILVRKLAPPPDLDGAGDVLDEAMREGERFVERCRARCTHA